MLGAPDPADNSDNTSMRDIATFFTNAFVYNGDDDRAPTFESNFALLSLFGTGRFQKRCE